MESNELVDKVKSFERKLFERLKEGLEQEECIKVMYVLLREQELIPRGPTLGKVATYRETRKFKESEDVGVDNLVTICQMIGGYEAHKKIKGHNGIQNDYYSGPDNILSVDKANDVYAYSDLITIANKYISNNYQLSRKKPIKQDHFEKILDSYFSEIDPFKEIKISRERLNKVKKRIKNELVKEYTTKGYVTPTTPPMEEITALMGKF